MNIVLENMHDLSWEQSNYVLRLPINYWNNKTSSCRCILVFCLIGMNDLLLDYHLSKFI